MHSFLIIYNIKKKKICSYVHELMWDSWKLSNNLETYHLLNILSLSLSKKRKKKKNYIIPALSNNNNISINLKENKTDNIPV